jgi:hypothetical protein
MHGNNKDKTVISKQDVPYQTHGGTCCPRLSTPMTRSLEDSSMTNHIKPQHRISPRSHHIRTDGRPTLSTLHTSQTQHHKDEKTCMTLMTPGLSIITNHKNPMLKYEGLGNQY